MDPEGRCFFYRRRVCLGCQIPAPAWEHEAATQNRPATRRLHRQVHSLPRQSAAPPLRAARASLRYARPIIAPVSLCRPPPPSGRPPARS